MIKYQCRDCGKTYIEKPNYCSCGNDSFIEIEIQDYNETENNEDYTSEEKTNPLTIIIAIVIAVAIFIFIAKMMNVNQRNPELSDEYLTSIRQEMMKNFDPSGIKRSGYCIISFQLNDEGWIQNRKFIQTSPSEDLNKKVFKMLQSTTIVEKPPKTYKGSTIKLEFGCIVEETEVSCYSKNILDTIQEK